MFLDIMRDQIYKQMSTIIKTRQKGLFKE